jgi:hypothetical protein
MQFINSKHSYSKNMSTYNCIPYIQIFTLDKWSQIDLRLLDAYSLELGFVILCIHLNNGICIYLCNYSEKKRKEYLQHILHRRFIISKTQH